MARNAALKLRARHFRLVEYRARRKRRACKEQGDRESDAGGNPSANQRAEIEAGARRKPSSSANNDVATMPIGLPITRLASTIHVTGRRRRTARRR
jgi:hypothetical protein